MALLINDALHLWKSIPTESLHGAVEAAIIEAGSFLATNGLVAKLWASRKGKAALEDHAALGSRFRNEEHRYLASPGARLPTEEEHAANKEEFRRIQRILGPGTRPKGWGA